MEASSSTLQGSTETLARGIGILESVAAGAMVKAEMPEDERQILAQIEATVFCTCSLN